MPSLPSTDDLLHRLKVVYCRHRAISYELYDQLVAEERITFQEVQELVEVLFTEVQHVGLYDFIFREAAADRERAKRRIVEIEAALKRLGGFIGIAEKDGHLDRAAAYRAQAQQLVAESKALMAEG